MKKIVLASSLFLLAACGEEGSWQEVTPGAVQLGFEVNGELASSETQKIGAPLVKHTWTYKIQSMAPEGKWVKKGQPLLSFDAQDLRDRLRKSQNELDSALKNQESQQLQTEQKLEELKLSVAELKMNLDKAQRKSEQIGDFRSQSEIKKLQIDLELAKKAHELGLYKVENASAKAKVEASINATEVDRLQSEVTRVKKEIASMNILAPKEGMVVYVPDHNGEKSAIGDSTYWGRNVIELPNLNKMIVKTSILEQDASRVAIGQAVEVTMDTAPDRVFKGKISSLGKLMRVKSRREPSMVFDAEVVLDVPDSELMRPGMAVRVNIIERELAQAVELPASAVSYQDGDAYVQVKSVFGERKRQVSVEAIRPGKVVISKGLAKGEQVVL